MTGGIRPSSRPSISSPRSLPAGRCGSKYANGCFRAASVHVHGCMWKGEYMFGVGKKLWQGTCGMKHKCFRAACVPLSEQKQLGIRHQCETRVLLFLSLAPNTPGMVSGAYLKVPQEDQGHERGDHQALGLADTGGARVPARPRAAHRAQVCVCCVLAGLSLLSG